MLDLIVHLSRRLARTERDSGQDDQLSLRAILLFCAISAAAACLLLPLFVGLGILIGTLAFGWTIGQSALICCAVLIVLSLLLGLVERIGDWWTGERWNRIKIAAWIMLPILFGTLWLTMGEFTPALLISLAAFAMLWTIGHVHYKHKAFKEWSERRRLRKEQHRAGNDDHEFGCDQSDL